MAVSYGDVLKAATRIERHVHRTPVMTSELLSELAGCELYFKCENLQKAGAFKARGAVNAVFSLDDGEAASGVATHSSGNHGAAVARAASLRGIPSFIVVPENAKAVKKAAIVHYGGVITTCTPTLEARERALADVIEQTGAAAVHPFDQDEIIAGQGTAAVELVEQVPGLDAIVTPVGGGGLLAGCALVAEQVRASIYGAEPEGADDAYRSMQTGERVTSQVPNTICDGLQTTVGQRNFAIMQGKVDGILLASDDEVIAAMELLWTRLKLVVEPSSAVTFAALLRNRELFSGRKVALVLTGGNVDLTDLPFR